MKKIFKALTIAVIALVAVFTCAFAAACKTDDEYVKSDYNFTIVYADGTPVNGQTDSTTGGKVYLQMCTNQCVDLNLPGVDIYADAQGRVSISQARINELFDSATDVTQFAFHVHNVKNCKADVSIDVNGKGDYKVTVTAE